MKLFITLLAVLSLAMVSQTKREVNQKANDFMDYCNKKEITAGCFYIIGDSLVTLKNYE